MDQNIQVETESGQYRSRLARILKAPKKLYRKALEQEADLYHFHDPEFIPYGKKLRKKGKRVIYDVHEDLPRQIHSKHWVPRPLKKILSVLLEWYENKAVKKFSGIVTATDHIRDRFRPYNPNTISVKNYPILAHFQTQDPPSSPSNKICYIGSITKARGILEVIKALEDTDAELELAGTFHPPSLREEVSKMPAWEQVKVHGYLEREQVQDLLTRSFAGIVTLHPTVNYRDAIPVKLFEYMAAELPVIASDFPFLKEIVEGADGGVCVNPLSPDEIREAIRYLMDNRERAKEMGKKGKKAVHDQYHWEKEAEALIGFYHSLCKV